MADDAAPRRSHLAIAARLVNLITPQLVTDAQNWSMAIQPINLAYETDEVTYQCQPDLCVFDQPLEAVVVDPGNVAVTFLRPITGAQANQYEQIPGSGLLPALTVAPADLFAGI